MIGNQTVLLLLVVGLLLVIGLVVVVWLVWGGRAEMRAFRQQIDADRNAGHELERQLHRSLDQSLGGMSQRIHESLTQQTSETTKSLITLHEKLGAIDQAHHQLRDLGQHLLDLKGILNNKQARGAFGEQQLADLVSTLLPGEFYALQFSFSSGVRVDCLLKLPNPPGSIAVDAKFPLEGYRALIDLPAEEDSAAALRQFGKSVRNHIDTIADKYIIPGETADFAMMFLPAEAVYAEIHASLSEVVDYAFKRRVFLVSPTTLMATLTTIRGIMRDVKLQQQALEIKKQIGLVLKDVERLEQRGQNLGRHFARNQRDIDEIDTSVRQISQRVRRIAGLDVEESG